MVVAVAAKWRHARPLRADLAIAVALYAATLAARWPLLDGPVFGDEAAHYYVARHWGAAPAGVFPETPNTAALWWQRPLFSVLLAPGAMVSFGGYRSWHAVLAGLVVPAAFAVARRAGVSRAAAALSAAVVGLLPALALWHGRVFADTMLATWILLAVLARQTGRNGTAALLVVAAAWTKEPGYLAVGLHAASTWWREARSGQATLWPLRLGRDGTAALAACIAAPVPLAVAILGFQGRRPGWSEAPLTTATGAALVASVLIGAVLVAGLLWPRTRGVAGAGLAYPAGFLVYAALGGGIDGWYTVVPGTLATVAGAVVLHRAWHVVPRRVARPIGPVVAACLLVLAGAAIAAPSDSPARAAVLPLDDGRPSLPELAAQNGQGILDAWRLIDPHEREVVFLVDVGWFYVLFPAAEDADVVGYAYSEFHGDLGAWVEAIEKNGRVTLLQPLESPLNRAIRDTYRDCLRGAAGGYWVIEGPACAGRGEQLIERFEAYGDT